MKSYEKIMNVTLLPDYFFPLFSGAEIHVYNLAQQLQKRGLNVSILTRNVPKLFKKRGTLRVYGFPSVFGKYHWYMGNYYLPLFDPLFSLTPILKKQLFKNSIVHAHGPIILSIAAHKKFYNFPLLLSVHDYWPICFQRSLFLPNGKVCDLVENCNQCLSPYMGQLTCLSKEIVYFNRLLLEKVDRFIAVSRFVKSSLIKSGIPAKKIDVVHNWIDLEGIRMNTQSIPEKKENIALFVGQVSKQKGIHVAISAMSHIARELSDFKLRVVGSGSLVEILKKRVEREGLSGVVSFLGRVNRETLFNEYRNAKLFICPSIWPDPCPTVILEAMAFKLPIIASNVGGIPELVNHGYTGFLFPRGDDKTLSEYVLKLLSDDVLCRRLGEKSQSAVKSFDINLQIPKIIKLYSE
jgi:glycogen(starch) synthase